jgi:hypothetical protein
VAPPKLGKTWFLHRVNAEVEAREPDRWLVSYADMRTQSANVRTEPEQLIKLLFRLVSQPINDSPTPDRIAQQILTSGRPYLCLLDSAELLNEDAAVALRSYVGQIYDLVQAGGQPDLRLGVVVASRRDDKWRGVTPSPRLSLQSVTEFDAHAVHEAVRSLADDMGKTFEDATYQQHASRVREMTQGLPALLIGCLEWIRSEQWRGIDRLESQHLFELLAKPHIEQVLLADESLFPLAHRPSDEARYALKQALRVLTRYRLLTQSHLRYHLDVDAGFAKAVRRVGWSTEDMWTALSGTALLKWPLNEPWQEIHPAIRRLLYRYYYPSDAEQADAHRDAQRFVQIWADRQSGKEQAVGLVESLWHEAAFLRIVEPRTADVAATLSESARKLSQALRPSGAYPVTELQAYAAKRIIDDEEFHEAVGNIIGLADSVAGIVKTPL